MYPHGEMAWPSQRRRSGWAAFLLILFAALNGSLCIAREIKVPVEYREWLERDVAYIITHEEQEAFLNLTTNQQRDEFIQRFWDIRNPDPGSPTNSYRDEIYRRISYANEFFGPGSGTDGWRTDRGRVYITLGNPQQRAYYRGLTNVRPLEIWFYSSTHPSLPSFFYVVFFQREAGSDYRLYSPSMDGPENLVTTTNSGNTRLGAFRIIDQAAGREVSRTTLSLIPNEPVDLDTATASMQSDLMLANIRGLANTPMNKDLLNERRRLLEAVSHRIILGQEFTEFGAVPLRDSDGLTNVHYVVRVKRPEFFSVAEDNNHRFYYSATIAMRVLTWEGKQIFQQERKLSAFLSDAELSRVKERRFAYEGMLPLPPGRYKLEFRLADDIKKTAYRGEYSVVVPEPSKNLLQVTDVVPFSAAENSRSGFAPFMAAGVKFTSLLGGTTTLMQGQDLKLFYQIWTPATLAKTAQSKLQVEYAYGRMGLQDTKIVKDEVATRQADAVGSIVNGKRLSTADMPPGGYRMTVTVTDPETHQRAFSTFRFEIVTSNAPADSWNVYDPELGSDAQRALRLHQRGLCYEAQGDMRTALELFQKSFETNRSDETVRAKLVETYFSQKAFSAIANLYGEAGLTEGTDDGTVLRIADSLDKVGNLPRSIDLLEKAIKLRPQSADLYKVLAGYYTRVGDTRRASALQAKEKTLTSQ